MRAAVCADTVTMAFGRPNVASIRGPRRCMKAPAAPGSSAIIGEPWETKSAGRRETVSMRPLQHPAPCCAFDALARSVREGGTCRPELVYLARHDDPRRPHASLRLAARRAPDGARLPRRRAAPAG